ncbi:RNA pseudouridine synthase [Paenibacillus sp. MY03]|uniref:RluA family pseudouridine synthase n=1 Tax=Paenibacillus sp. MY03 TaxID=302980 RepID=UPI000B3D3B60|nr:RluA family pseudouridine synthase [Paenibacillus sp. MY03]OUS69127.1 RNA pseudouridine synthase [Paenibacillus sp. MY03]
MKQKNRSNPPKASRPNTSRQGASRPSASRPSASRPSASRPNASRYTVKETTELLLFLIHTSKLGRNSAKSMLARGQVSVDNVVVKEYNHPLEPGQTVSVSRERVVEETPLVGLDILHEDEDIIVIRKDAGLLSISTGQDNEITAYRQLMAHVRAKDPKSRIFVVHRLDRDTSGVMMFAKSERIQQQLQNAWQEAVKERSYVALVEGNVKKAEGTITSWLKESSTLKMYSSQRQGDGQHAVTHYKTLQAGSACTLLEVRLETGRKNQIRVHMEDLGHPIVGDKKYGSRSKVLGRLGLHARVLAFSHPTTGELLRFETDIPKSFLAQLKPSSSEGRR